ncbi:hypothetical protein C8Q74DRAFT_1215689 [Fomes fomentarius]|nr:hypothetical protein C8Q74DRAFT_1215689 [Fomes fomentarius]
MLPPEDIVLDTTPEIIQTIDPALLQLPPPHDSITQPPPSPAQDPTCFQASKKRKRIVVDAKGAPDVQQPPAKKNKRKDAGAPPLTEKRNKAQVDKEELPPLRLIRHRNPNAFRTPLPVALSASSSALPHGQPSVSGFNGSGGATWGAEVIADAMKAFDIVLQEDTELLDVYRQYMEDLESANFDLAPAEELDVERGE